MARKDHRCHWCSRIISAGEGYHRRAARSVDGFHVWKGCDHCCALVRIFDFTDPSYWGGISEDDFADYIPRTLSELRLKVLWCKQWRRKNGDLYPVPDGAA